MIKFQSTHPRGVRHSADYLVNFVSGVSIHAPTRGATCFADTEILLSGSFNPRTHEGCDINTQKIMRIGKQFQSTHPRGVRLRTCSRAVNIIRSFNPRTHEGCDYRLVFCPLAAKFQSTHPRGVRPTQIAFRSMRSCFNPRTHEGCDQPSLSTCCQFLCFNPRTHEGCDGMSNHM